MSKPPRPYTRTKFCFRWRGRRWYDPNERKVIWSTVGTAALTLGIRMIVLAVSSTQQPSLYASLYANGIPPQGVVGTAHDLSATGLYHVTQSRDVCAFCHPPHGTPKGLEQAVPEWNHVTTGAQFKMFSSSTLAGSVDAQPLGPSLACLSCHDGTVAVGALIEAPEGGGNEDYSEAQRGVNPATGLMEGASVLGTDLSSIHPISVTYRADLNKGLRPPTELVGVRLYPANVSGAEVHCGSCHDPHNYGTPGETAPFLRVTMRGSALCLRCHLM